MAVNATISIERKVAKGYSPCDFLENLYLSYKENYVSKCGDKEKSSYYEFFYDLMVNKIVNYMNAVFTKQKINNGETKFSSQDFFSYTAKRKKKDENQLNTESDMQEANIVARQDTDAGKHVKL